MFELYLTDSFQREVIHSSGGCESSKNKIIHMNINWWIRNIRPNYCISEFKCDLNSNRLSSKTCNGFRVIIILYTIDLYVVLIPQNESKWNKIVSIQTMSNQKIICLPPVANTLRDLHMRFTWVLVGMRISMYQTRDSVNNASYVKAISEHVEVFLLWLKEDY